MGVMWHFCACGNENDDGRRPPRERAEGMTIMQDDR